MMTDKVQRIREEVEKLKSNLVYGACSSQVAMETRCKEEACNEVLAILDDMQKEPNDDWKYSVAEKLGISREEYDKVDYNKDYGKEEPVKIKKGCKYRSICNVTNNDTGNICFVAGKIYLAPEDNTLVSEENGWLCDTSNDASNFELVEEPPIGLDNGDMSIERWKQAVKAASNQRSYRSSKGLTETRDDYFVDGVQWADEHPKEEPVSLWHDASEKPERDDLLIETNDGRIIHRQSINNYGMVKRWAYYKDILNLSNVERTGKDWKEEPVSEELGEYINELSKQFPEVSFAKLSRIAVRVAKWQKENLWKPADGDDLPEIDREVIVLVQDYPDDKDHLRVVFAHRPNKYAKVWNSDLGEEQVVEIERHGKGGWNIPNVKYWLDCSMPKEIEL